MSSYEKPFGSYGGLGPSQSSCNVSNCAQCDETKEQAPEKNFAFSYGYSSFPVEKRVEKDGTVDVRKSLAKDLILANCADLVREGVPFDHVYPILEWLIREAEEGVKGKWI